jgi:DNA-binding NarL/FixJ family response regulator
VTPIGASPSGLSDYHLGMAADSHDHAALEAPAAEEVRTATVLVYSSHDATRARLITALGPHPAPGLNLTYVEASRGQQVVDRLDAGGIDLAILDGEAAPTGGMGLARQIKDELDNPPPVLLVVGRRDDAWLATWSRAESVISHPIDAVQAAQAVAALLAGDAGPVAAAH